jgi:hypothetical protein
VYFGQTLPLENTYFIGNTHRKGGMNLFLRAPSAFHFGSIVVASAKGPTHPQLLLL